MGDPGWVCNKGARGPGACDGKTKCVARLMAIVTLRMDDETLVHAARKGDRRAFDLLVARYARAVVARQYGWTRNASTAEDLAQETFLRAWQGLARLKDPKAFGSWLLSIGGFVGQEWLRRKASDQRLRMSAPAPAEPGRDNGPDLPLARAVAELAPEVQHLLALRHDQGLTCEEIAKQLGRPIGTVTKTLSRAYEQLRARLDVK